MAEGVVSFVLVKLSDALIAEADSLHGVRAQVEWLREELMMMKAFLDDADARRREGDVLAKNWVRQVREVAYRTEDILDTLMVEVEPQRRQQRRCGGLTGCIRRYASFPCELRSRHRFAAEIEGLRAQIDEIKASRERYGIFKRSETTTTGGEASSSSAVYVPRQMPTDPIFDLDRVVVGFDAHVETILVRILDGSIAERTVVSVVGMGGIGKTTLAANVYNRGAIAAHFAARAWVYVSQDFRVGEVLRSVAAQVLDTGRAELNGMEADDLKEKLHNFLKERRYLIVLDDVWSPEVWEHVKWVLPEVRNGSRVLLTTRSMAVARSAEPRIPPYHLPFLNMEESWELFRMKAFPSNQICPPVELEAIARRLVRECRGLPLALVVLAGLLSRLDPNPVAWRRVAESLDWASSTQDGAICLEVLGLSYNALPHHYMRSCFLYLCAFPEGWEIEATDLIRLWIAEGFVPQRGTQMMEDTARAYLDELAQRSMIQAVDRDSSGASVVRFRIHDLFRDFCLREAGEADFLNVYSTGSIRLDRTAPRLALHDVDDVKDWCPPSNLRSLLCFGTEVTSDIFNGLKLLRVIHFKGSSKCGFEGLPEEITRMISLRYLRLGGGRDIRELPSSISNLRNLQTLDIAETRIIALPESLGKIQTLRHLLLPGTCLCPPTIVNLINLQTLTYANARGGWIERGFETLVSIRDLGVNVLAATQEMAFFYSLRMLKDLSSLQLRNAELISTEFLTGLSEHQRLHRLYLDGMMPQGQLLSDLGTFLPHLASLKLRRSVLEHDPMTALEKLPKLIILELDIMSYVGQVMVCSAGGFRRLQALNVCGLEELQDWKVEAGAMPNLTSLTIRNCWRLQMLPEGLQHATALQRLVVYDDREEFRGRLQQGGGEDWHKIQQVPSIIVRDPRSIIVDDDEGSWCPQPISANACR